MPEWARVVFGGRGNRWHIVRGLWAICGRQHFDYPRVERIMSTIPPHGTPCKHCIAKQAREALA
jgi:hypothetical protein